MNQAEVAVSWLNEEHIPQKITTGVVIDQDEHEALTEWLLGHEAEVSTSGTRFYFPDNSNVYVMPLESALYTAWTVTIPKG